ncbi:MAG: LysR substrate-binding domain-containing protein [Polaromonas sp.]|nr:LysR substrate-binding domain-containing protein [Polaromonas sp.]
MRNMDLDSLQIFKAVADFGGISRAAEQLHRVPSNISTRVKNLEAQLGVALFHRQSGKLTLSAEGLLLLDYAQRLLQLSTEATLALRSGTPRGTLRLGTSESTAATRLPSLLSRYHRHFPEVHIELVTGTSGALLVKVRNFEIDAAFVAEAFVTPGLEMQSAFVEELVLISAAGAPPIRTPQDAQNRTLIAFSTGCSYRRILMEWLGSAAVRPERVLELGSYHAIVACVAAGAGIAIMPRLMLEAIQAHEELAVFALPPQVARSKTGLVWRTGHASVALEALRGELPPLASAETPCRRETAFCPW